MSTSGSKSNEHVAHFLVDIHSHRTLNTHKGEYIYLKSLNNEIKLDIEN